MVTPSQLGMIRIQASPKGNETPSPLLQPSPSLSKGSINIMEDSPMLSPHPDARNSHKVASHMYTDDESEDYDSEQENQPPSSLAPHKESRKLSASRRAAHLESEKKRRRNINHGFEDLRMLVPFCTDLDSKAGILRKSADYIRELTGKMDNARSEVDMVSVTSEEETLAQSLTLLRSRSKSANI